MLCCVLHYIGIDTRGGRLTEQSTLKSGRASQHSPTLPMIISMLPDRTVPYHRLQMKGHKNRSYFEFYRSYHVSSYYITSLHITSHHMIHHITPHLCMSYHIISHHVTSHLCMSYHIISHHITAYHTTA